MADIVVLGSVPKGGAILRSKAKAGDLIYTTGKLGLSVAALQAFRKGKKPTAKSAPRHFFPEPRIDVGRVLRAKRLATSMIDLSDGLSTDLTHICEESDVGAVLYADSIPRVGGADGLEMALNGGEDYELLFTASPKTRAPERICEVAVRAIGEVISRGGLWLSDASGKRTKIKPGGWEHFRRGMRNSDAQGSFV